MKNTWNKTTSHMGMCTSAFLSDSGAKAFSTLPPSIPENSTLTSHLLLHWVARSSTYIPLHGTPGAPGQQAGHPGGGHEMGQLGPEPRLL